MALRSSSAVFLTWYNISKTLWWIFLKCHTHQDIHPIHLYTKSDVDWNSPSLIGYQYHPDFSTFWGFLFPSSFVRHTLLAVYLRMILITFFSNFVGTLGMSRRRHSSIFILIESFVFEWRSISCRKWPFWGEFSVNCKKLSDNLFPFFPRIKPISVPYRSPSLNGLELFDQIL